MFVQEPCEQKSILPKCGNGTGTVPRVTVEQQQ